MHITPEQAQHSLDDIHAATRRMRKSLAAANTSGHLMLWGLVWAGAFLACGIRPDSEGVAWAIGNSIGGIGSMIIGYRTSREKLASANAAGEGWRFLGLWVALFAFVALWIWLLRPNDGAQIAAFVCTAVMFLYVVMGLWFEAWFLAWLGLAVTVLTVVGYSLLPEQFYFWMAVAGGGSLFAAGLYINRVWK